jgi:hypothetical protein
MHISVFTLMTLPNRLNPAIVIKQFNNDNTRIMVHTRKRSSVEYDYKYLILKSNRYSIYNDNKMTRSYHCLRT